ncbi:MAG TPA: sugar phosphate isomerase/epimerase [Thermoproteota archaeon]|nr:sugar phosphate isomerase/epimerase [Thermoproteota archaeon]
MIATNGLLFAGLPLQEAIQALSELKLDAFELPHPIFYKRVFKGSAPEEVKLLVSLLRSLDLRGLRIASVNAANDFLKPVESEFSEEVRKTKLVVDTAAELNVKLIRVFVGEPKEGMSKQRCRDLAIKGLREVADYAEGTGKVLALENHGRYSNDFGEEMAILNTIGSDALRLNLDSGNYYWFGYTVAEVESILRKASRLAVHTHLKNETSIGKHQRREPGECTVARLWRGDLDIAGFVRDLRDAGYEGAYSIEEEFAGMEDMTLRELREAVSEDIVNLRKALEK